MLARVGIAATCFLLTPAFADDPEPTDEPAAEIEAAAELPASTARAATPEPVVVDISVQEATVVCERYVPTGSRISTTRCFSRAGAEPSEAERRLLRQDVEEMRRMQMGRALARQRALEDFARRAAGAAAAGN